MTPQHDFTSLPFCGISLFKTIELKEQSTSLADKLSNSAGQYCLGFDRSVWAQISSGQMPPQLYSFRQLNTAQAPQALEEVLIVLFKDDSTSFIEQHNSFCEKFSDTLLPLQKSCFDESITSFGNVNENVYEEEDFNNSYYLSYINWESSSQLPTPPQQARTYHIKTKDGSCEISIAKDLNEQEVHMDKLFGTTDPVTNNRALSAAYFFFPSLEVLSELSERSRDKEKNHINTQYTGVRC